MSRSIGSSDPGASPSAAAAASTGEPSRAHRWALEATSARYGLAGPPSPSTARQIGASASKIARRAAASGSVASRPSAVGRSTTAEPIRTPSAAAPYASMVARRSRAMSGDSTGSTPAASSPATGSSSSIHSSEERIDASAARASGVSSGTAACTRAASASLRRAYAASRSTTSSPRWRATTSSPNASRPAAYSASRSVNRKALDTCRGYGRTERAGCVRWHHRPMHLHFLGGATTVTGSKFLIDTGRAKVLIDCGMFQGSPNETVRNRVPFGFEPSELDAVLITHAHLDHCGLLPILVRDGYRGAIHLTDGTAELARLVLLDSGKLHEQFAKREARWEKRNPDRVAADDRAEADAYQAAVELTKGGTAPDPEVPVAAAVPPDAAFDAPLVEDPEAALRAQPPELEVDLDAPLYTVDDAEAVLPLFSTVDYDEEIEVAPGVTATFLDAGHILGSAIIRVRVAGENGAPDTTIVCSGDLGRPGTPIVRDPTVLTDADYVLVESTYGGREHEPSDEAVRILAETVRLVAESRGVLLVPSFAIGRTQEIVWELDRLIDRGEIPLLPLYLDSPMASKASDIYRRHAQYFDDETGALLRKGGSPLDYPNQFVTNDVEDSKAIERAPRPYMIVASNGMLTGGRVVSHLRNLIDDPDATILFVGYQGKGTLGSHLQAGATTVKLDGQVREVRCQVRSISGFSAHADESELLDWLGAFARGKQPGDAGYPKRVFLVHGDPEAQVALEPRVRALGFETHVPHWHERVALDD
jgi:metallo-beta-lactamase family protein